ncbi:MAG: hypothetical protein ACREPE_06690 [Lysobacter sp.]
MNENSYTPPVVAVDATAPRLQASEFYVVSARKFVLLFLATFGLYQLYWFYMHWARYRRVRKQQVWPVARAIFSIFFTHSLAEEIDHTARSRAPAYRWSPQLAATGYVTASLASIVLDRLAANSIGSPATDLASLLLLGPLCLCLLAIQRAANVACDQPRGDANSSLSWANWIWRAIGGLVWLMVLLGLTAFFVPAF